jgi:hypothetical protein
VSAKQNPERARLEAAIRDAVEAVLPSLINEVLTRLGDMPSNHRRPTGAQELGPLFDAAHSGGEAAVRALLDRPIEELRLIARVLDRQLGDKARRSKDANKIRDAISAEILRRARRNDVFLYSDDASGGVVNSPRDKGVSSPQREIPHNLQTREGFERAAAREVQDFYKTGGTKAQLETYWAESERPARRRA